MPDATTPHTVFVSHAHADNAFAKALVAALRRAGADVWCDLESLGPGVMLRPAIMREINDRRIFIVVLSKSACASQWVREECEWAYDLRREEPDSRVYLPVLAGPLERADFRELLYLKAMYRVEGDNLQPLPQSEAIAEVLRLLGLTPAPETHTPTLENHVRHSEWVRNGVQLLNARDYDGALAAFEQALALDANNPGACAGRGKALLGLGRTSEADAAFQRARQLGWKG